MLIITTHAKRSIFSPTFRYEIASLYAQCYQSVALQQNVAINHTSQFKPHIALNLLKEVE